MAEAQTLRISLIALDAALAKFTAKIPPVVQPDDFLALDQREPPFAYGAKTAMRGFVGAMKITCAAYSGIIKMYQAANLLVPFDSGVEGRRSLETGSREKRLSAARAVATLAHQLTTEWERANNVEGAKNVFCLLTAVSRNTLVPDYQATFLEHRVAELTCLSRATLACSIAGQLQRSSSWRRWPRSTGRAECRRTTSHTRFRWHLRISGTSYTRSGVRWRSTLFWQRKLVNWKIRCR